MDVNKTGNAFEADFAAEVNITVELTVAGRLSGSVMRLSLCDTRRLCLRRTS